MTEAIGTSGLNGRPLIIQTFSALSVFFSTLKRRTGRVARCAAGGSGGMGRNTAGTTELSTERAAPMTNFISGTQ